MAYRHRSGETISSPTHATLIGFDGIREVYASDKFSAVSSTIATDILASANLALTGAYGALPFLEPTAEITAPGMQALYNTIRQVQRRIREIDRCDDLIFPLVQEVMSYQLLTAWPKRNNLSSEVTKNISILSFNIAVEYIDANLSRALILAEVAAVAGISVRSLQTVFRKNIGQTPIQFILDRRLSKAHDDLTSPQTETLSIIAIARRWGFVHISDFGQRYRRKYGCTPTETRLRTGYRS